MALAQGRHIAFAFLPDCLSIDDSWGRELNLKIKTGGEEIFEDFKLDHSHDLHMQLV